MIKQALFVCALAALVGCSSSNNSGDDGTGNPADSTPSSGDSTSPGDDSTTPTGDSTSTGDSTTPPDDSTSTGDSVVPPGDSTPPTDTGVKPDAPTPTGGIKNVFVILMENHNWSSIKGSTSAPYINTKLLPAAAHAEQYYNPPGIHPSLPNYLWIEAGDNFSIANDLSPSSNHQATKDHLVSQLQGKGISWKSYQEDIVGTTCPLSNSTAASGLHYAPKHNPMVYFDDVTDTNKATSPNCIAHVRPFTELSADLSAGKAPRYSFITPNLCNDMHGDTGCPADDIKTGDTWLSTTIPMITASAQYKDGGAIFVVWDEAGSGDGPIGMIVLSPLSKPGGYSNTVKYTHSSLLKTLEEIFGVALLRDAGNTATNDLKDLFATFP